MSGTGGGAPPGWPAGVRPPGAPDWERSAVAWLYDQCPPEYRDYDVLRRHPAVLARFADSAVAGAQSAVAAGLAGVRAELREVVSVEVIAEAVAAYEREDARLVGIRRSVGLVEEALRGRRFAPRL